LTRDFLNHAARSRYNIPRPQTVKQVVHARTNDRGNAVLLPSWVDVTRADSFVSRTDPIALRLKRGLEPEDVLLVNIGTVCKRKGHYVRFRAIAYLNQQYRGGPPMRFLMVGAREGIHLDLLRRDIARLGLTNLTLMPETREVFDFFVAADLFVCSSYEESFPRVVMEAMAFRTPLSPPTCMELPSSSVSGRMAIWSSPGTPSDCPR
jgi:glycosyltransferase involved in cell wall biosynthesis